MAKRSVSRAGKKGREKVSPSTQLRLWVRAAGFCEFAGCHAYVLRDDLTLSETNLSNIAHIVAASRNGPRGKHAMPLARRGRIENLMLMCTKHHKLIDCAEHRDEYSVETLRSWKAEHEERIKRLTSVGPKNKAMLIRLRGRIGSREVEIPSADMRDAMFPLYPIDDGIDIDLTGEPQPATPAQWSAMAKRIDEQVKRLHEHRVERRAPENVAAFGLAAIPLLVHLGRQISDKVPTAFFQQHRGTESWRWADSGKLAKFSIDRIRDGAPGDPIALILSVSGKVAAASLPASVASRGAIYEIRLEDDRPSPARIATKNDLLLFTRAYLDALALIQSERPDAREIHLFAAVPAAVAMACGYQLIEKAHPALIVYEFNKASGFTEALKENV
jgi:hypothetical protein